MMKFSMKEKSMKTGESLAKMTRIPGFKKFFLKMWDSMSRKMFGETAGFKNIFLVPDERSPWTEEQKDNLKNEIDKIYSYMDYCFSVEKRKPINFSLINNSFTHVLKHDLNTLTNNNHKKTSRPAVRCGLGTGMGSIGYDGSIFGCQEQTSKGKDNIFYIGNLNTGINKELHSRLLASYVEENQQMSENPKKCEKCNLCAFCHEFTCPSTTYDLFDSFFITSEIKCDWFSWLFNNSAILMNKLTNEDNLIFKDYLDNNCNLCTSFFR